MEERFSVSFDKEEMEFLRSRSKMHGGSVSAAVRSSVRAAMEDAAREAKDERRISTMGWRVKEMSEKFAAMDNRTRHMQTELQGLATLVCWLAPPMLRAVVGEDESAEWMAENLSPTDLHSILFDMGRNAELQRAGLPGAMRDLARQHDLDTEALIGETLHGWERIYSRMMKEHGGEW